MNQYRKDIEKLYQKIVKVVSRGQGYSQNYYDLIDEVIEYGESVLLQDVMITKFKIDTTTFANVDSLKKNTFKKIAGSLDSKLNIDYKNLFLSKGVYTLGTQFFEITSSIYLGDIKQFDTVTISQALEVYTFYPDMMKVAIPKFIESPFTTIDYKKDFIVYYGSKLYQCSDNYTWNKDSRITPTFSNYWFEISAGTQSLNSVIDQEISLLDRYSKSIDILRKYYYIDYSGNKYLESNYIDEYFE